MRGRVLLLCLPLLAACAAAVPPSKPVAGAGRLGRVAVLPFRVVPTVADPTPGLGAGIAARLAAQLGRDGVPTVDATRAVRTAPSDGAADWTAASAAAAARDAGAALAVFGTLTRFQERDGSDWGVRTPATVWYEATLVHAADATVLDRQRFAVTQESLSGNLLALPEFVAGGGHWLTRDELLGQGLERTAHAFAEAIAHAP